MSDLWLRVGIVAAALLISLLVILFIRRRPASITVAPGSLGPGIYLFTSSTCADCAGARARLEDMSGIAGFVEIRWEDQPAIFEDVGIDAVPCTVVVADNGSASLYPGMPDRALEQLNP